MSSDLLDKLPLRYLTDLAPVAPKYVRPTTEDPAKSLRTIPSSGETLPALAGVR